MVFYVNIKIEAVIVICWRVLYFSFGMRKLRHKKNGSNVAKLNFVYIGQYGQFGSEQQLETSMNAPPEIVLQ